MIEWVLQTNSTMTPTVFQETSGTSFLGFPVTDLIAAIAGAIVAIFAVVTVLEGKKNRRKDSIEKQLESLYNPMFELLDRAEPHFGAIHTAEWVPRYQRMLKTDVTELQSALVKYGHYLDSNLYDLLKELFSFEMQEGDRHLIFPDDIVTAQNHDLKANWTMCFLLIKSRREELIHDLRKLT